MLLDAFSPSGAEHQLAFSQRLAYLDVGRPPGAEPEAHHLARRGHVVQQLLVDGRLVRIGIGRQMHALDGAGQRAGQVAPRDLAEERGERRGHARQLEQTLVQGPVGVRLVLRPLARPEPRPAPPHVPVRQTVHEGLDGPRRRMDLVAFHGVAHVQRRPVQGVQNPPVQFGPLGARRERRVARFGRIRPGPHVGQELGRGARGPESVQVGVDDEEAVDVVPADEQFALRVLHVPHGEPSGARGRVLGDEAPAQRVGAVLLEQHGGFRVVLEAFRQFGAVLAHDVAQADAVSEGVRPWGAVLAVHEGADGQQGIEPSARLVDGLTDEVGRKRVRQPFLGALRVRVTPLRERHAARVEPHVDHLGHPPHTGRRVLGALVRDRVDVGLVHLQVVRQVRGRRLGLLPRLAAQHVRLGHQFGVRRDALLVPCLLAHPHRQGRPPVPLPRQGPVHVVLEEIAEPAVPDVPGNPRDLPVVGEEIGNEVRGPDEPALAGVLNQRVVLGARTERVGMAVGLLAPQHAAVLEHPEDPLVRVPAELARKGLSVARVGVRHALVEGAVGLEVADESDAVVLAHRVVVFAKGGRDVHDARARLEVHEVAGDHDPVLVRRCIRAQLLGRVVVEQGLIPQAQQLGATDDAGDLGVLGEVLAHERGREDHVFLCPALLPRPDDGVFDVFAYACRAVAHERPRGGRPDQQAGGRVAEAEPLAAVVGQREGHRDGRVVGVAVSLADLAGRERGAALGPPPHHLVALVQQAPVEQLLERPPHALDVVLAIRDVGLVQVHPEADAVGQVLPFLLIPEHGLDAGAVELGDAVLFDGLLAAIQDAKLLAHLDFDGQAVRVPPCLALAQVPRHGLVAREHVLDRPRQAMSRVRQPIGRRRPLIEDERRRALSLGQALLIDLPILPEADDLLFRLREVERRRHRLKHVLFHETRSLSCSVKR